MGSDPYQSIKTSHGAEESHYEKIIRRRSPPVTLDQRHCFPGRRTWRLDRKTSAGQIPESAGLRELHLESVSVRSSIIDHGRRLIGSSVFASEPEIEKYWTSVNNCVFEVHPKWKSARNRQNTERRTIPRDVSSSRGGNSGSWKAHERGLGSYKVYIWRGQKYSVHTQACQWSYSEVADI